MNNVQVTWYFYNFMSSLIRYDLIYIIKCYRFINQRTIVTTMDLVDLSEQFDQLIKEMEWDEVIETVEAMVENIQMLPETTMENMVPFGEL